MTLREYIKCHAPKKGAVAKLAKEIDVSAAFVTQLKNGYRKPSGKVIQAIDRATEGKVGLHDWTF